MPWWNEIWGLRRVASATIWEERSTRQSKGALAMEIAGDLTGTAAQVTNRPQLAGLTDEPVEAGAIEWLEIHFVLEFLGVFGGDGIVGGLGGAEEVFHSEPAFRMEGWVNP